MNTRLIACAQRSPEWVTARLGRLCGSKAADMLASGKGSAEAAGRRNLRVQLVLERITGRPVGTAFQSAAMKQGNEREADAAAVYEALTGEMLSFVGYYASTELMAGCSPDGVIGPVDAPIGLIEIKSPEPAAHMEYLRTGKVPGHYGKQVLHNLWITGAEWCDWLSYNPDFPDALQTKLVRVHRDDAEIENYRLKALAFLNECEVELQAVHTMADLSGQLAAAVNA